MENKLSRKIKKAFAYALAGAMAATVVGVGPFSAAGRVEATGGDIVINEDNFPDKVFRESLLKLEEGKDGVLTQEEIAGITELDLTGFTEDLQYFEDVNSAEGIEYFTNLEYLRIPSAKGLTSMDLSNNKNLRRLIMSNRGGIKTNGVGLKSLDLSNNTKLTKVEIDKLLNLSSIDFSSCKNLESLGLYGDSLTNVNLADNTSLKELIIESNGIKNLNISNNTGLNRLSIVSNSLTNIDLTNNINITDLSVKSDSIKTLNLSKNAKLNYLSIYDSSGISNLDLSSLDELTTLYLKNSAISSIDISKNKNLCFINCWGTNITKLDISNNPNLLKIYNEGTYEAEVDADFYEYYDESLLDKWLIYCNKGTEIITESKEDQKEEDKKEDKKEDKNEDKKEDTTPKYLNEWVDGKWYNADGTQTYKGTMSWKSNATGWWIEDTDGWYPTNQWQKIDGIWYFFKPDGYMASNEYYNGYWFNADGSWDDKYLLSWKSNSTGWWVEDISSDCRQSRLRNEVFATDFSVLDYVAANPNEKELNGVPIIPFL